MSSAVLIHQRLLITHIVHPPVHLQHAEISPCLALSISAPRCLSCSIYFLVPLWCSLLAWGVCTCLLNRSVSPVSLPLFLTVSVSFLLSGLCRSEDGVKERVDEGQMKRRRRGKMTDVLLLSLGWTVCVGFFFLLSFPRSEHQSSWRFGSNSYGRRGSQRDGSSVPSRARGGGFCVTWGRCQYSSLGCIYTGGSSRGGVDLQQCTSRSCSGYSHPGRPHRGRHG